MRDLKRILPVFLLFLFILTRTLVTQSLFIDQGNRITAIRLLEKAKQSAANLQWQLVYEQTNLGIQYGGSIPDLLYLNALAARELGHSIEEVLSTVARSLETTEWVQLSNEAARVLYADLLSHTLEWEAAITVLDEAPIVFSADAEYIRAQTYYRLGKLPQARAKIRAARSFFPKDGRFPLLFLKNEYRNEADFETLTLASGFLRNIASWSDETPELLLYATPFSTSEEQRLRFLQAYKATVEKPAQAYAVFALHYGLILEDEALKIIQSYTNDGIDFMLFRDFVSLIQTQELKTQIDTWLQNFEGFFHFDINKDGLIDLKAQYIRGRPDKIVFDHDQDGVASWNIDCDFGVPLTVMFEKMGLTVFYGEYPAVSAVEIAKPNFIERYDLNAEAFFWSPFDILSVTIPPLNQVFFIPTPKTAIEQITKRTLITHSNIITVEAETEKVIFQLFEGRPYRAEYFYNKELYARAIFENGILKSRLVDQNHDGYFEVTEIYTFDPEGSLFQQNQTDSALLKKMLFPAIDSPFGYYLSKIMIDLNKDSKPNYIEEYLPNGGLVKMWDINERGEWGIRLTKKIEYPSQQSFSEPNTVDSKTNEKITMIDQVFPKQRIIEQTDFVHPTNKNLITIILIDGVPNSVITSRGTQQFFFDEIFSLYWIGQQFDSIIAEQIIEQCNFMKEPGVSVISSINNLRFLVLKTENSYFVEHIEDLNE